MFKIALIIAAYVLLVYVITKIIGNSSYDVNEFDPPVVETDEFEIYN